MGRRRKKDLDLPPRMYRRGLTFYYVAASGQWINLGKDRARALRLWAELECALPTRVAVADVVQQYLDYIDGDGCPEKDRVAESTRRKYGSYKRTIETKFSGKDADELTVPMISRWRDSGEVKPVWFNGCLSVLRNAYRKGVQWGTVKANIPAEAEANETFVRERLVEDDEFRAVREKAPQWLQLAMDVAYMTGMREGDAIALRWPNIQGDRIYLEQQKTRRGGRRGTGTRQVFEISPALRSVLEAAKRRPIVGLFVVATDKGRPIKARRLQKEWAKARSAAGIKDATFRDIRGKAGTDAYEEGMDHQAFLGHAKREMSDRYVKAKRTIKTPTLKRRV